MSAAQSSLPIALPDLAELRPERFKVSHGLVWRTVDRRDGTEFITEVGPSIPAAGLAPVDEADLSYLRRREAPAPGHGEVIRVADLFSGAGGMSLGLAEACRAVGKQFLPVLAADVYEPALRVYADNFGIPQPEPLDLSQLSSLIEAPRTSFEVGLTKRFPRADIVVAGPPCQGHSNLNNYTRRNDPKNFLYLKVARFARLFEPSVLVIENVPTVVRDKNGVVGRTVDALSRMGYRVSSGTINLDVIGVAQRRKRHVLIAVHSGSHYPVLHPKEIQGIYSTSPRNVLWAIEDLTDHAQDSPYDTASEMTPVTRERVEYLFRNDQFDLPDEERPDCHRIKSHTYQSVYGRMYPDRPAPTITRGFATMGQGRFVHPLRPRTLTPHEAARLQFFPDFFSFRSLDKRKHFAEVIGNAVPSKLTYVIGLELLR